MLIVGPSLIILLAASLIVLFIKFVGIGSKRGIREKRVIREEHLYNRYEPIEGQRRFSDPNPI